LWSMESHSKKMKVQWIDSDIISTIPQSITENILIHMPIRDAVRTSILSRNWRSYWKSLPKLVFDKSVEVPSNCKTLKKLKLVSAILHILLQHTGSILEFYLNVGELDMDSEVKNCDFEPPSTFNGFSRLKCLRFNNVEITSKILQRVLSNCTLLTEVVLMGRGRVKDFDGENKFTFVELFELGDSSNLRSAESTLKDRDLTSRTVLFVTCLTGLKKRNDDDVDACWCSFGLEFRVFKVNEV
ncbi:F-box/FBD/LRR-repeat protein-like protein, partial [Tanacetum coccineum]